MKHLLMAASVLLLTVSTHGQTTAPAQPCTLKLSQAPAVRGVKLDMTRDELFSLFPGLSELTQPSEPGSYPNFGYGAFSITPSTYPTKNQFAGIEQYGVTLFDGRVVGLNVNYSTFPKGARWRNVDDLVQRFSESLHLPRAADWTPQPGNIRKLNCVGFEIAVSYAFEVTQISFYQQSWKETQKERLAAFEEKKRSEFKP